MPQFFRTPNDIQLLVGAENGTITAYKNIQINLNGTFTISDSNFLRARVGSHTSVAFGNLNGSHTLQCLVGNFRGGLSAFGSSILRSPNNTATENIATNLTFSIAPNPVDNFLTIDCIEKNLNNIDLKIFNVLGQPVYVSTSNSFPFQVNTGSLVSGTYILQIISGASSQNLKFVKQ